MIVTETAEMAATTVVGCALSADLVRLTIRGLPNTAGVQSLLFDDLSKADINVDDIIQTEIGARIDLCFTIERQHRADVERVIAAAVDVISHADTTIDTGLAKVSVVGVGMRSHPGVAATMFRALGDAEIPIANITTSEIKISCLVAKEHGARALRAVHDAFGLGHRGERTSAAPGVPSTDVSIAPMRAAGG
jgi:aspartate kinase